MKHCYFLVVLFLHCRVGFSQPAFWSLRKCIDIAINNNLNIKQSILEERTAEISNWEARLGSLPSASSIR
jgi:outer membrane protein